jgi:hypothetical protein
VSINLRDYSQTAQARGWGAGWPQDNRGNMATVVTKRSKIRIPVHKRVAEMLALILDEVERRGYAWRPGWCWGYANRAISGTSTPSNHSWGLAFDGNAPENSYNSTGKHTIPTWVGALFNRYGWAWGGDYTGSKRDWMHFEFMGTPADADRMTALARKEIGGTAAAGSSAPDLALQYYYEAGMIEFPASAGTTEPIPVDPTRAHKLILAPNDADVTVKAVFNWSETNNRGTGGNWSGTVPIKSGKVITIPKGTAKADLAYSSSQPFRGLLLPA